MVEMEYVDTPKGIFTASGIWFRTREASVQSYAAGVLEHESLGGLLSQAEVWLRSSQSVAIWALPLFLFTLPVIPAIGATLFLFLGWSVLGPSFVSRALLQGFKILDLVFLQGVYYVATMSLAAMQGQFVLLWIGLAGFILLRWGILAKGVEPLLKLAWDKVYSLPVPDHVLRSLIVRAALAHRVSLPELEAIERDVAKRVLKNK